MELRDIQEMDSLDKIYEYIIKNSFEEKLNKNMYWDNKLSYSTYEGSYLNLKYTKTLDSQLDTLFPKLVKIYAKKFEVDITNDSSFLEDIASLVRIHVYDILKMYYTGELDEEIQREFKFKIENNISNFKKLFTYENIDRFVSFLLIKCTQEATRSTNEISSYIRRNKVNNSYEYNITDFKSLDRTIKFSSSRTEEAEDISVEEYLYLISDNKDKFNDDIVKINNARNIYNLLSTLSFLLTDKQKEFVKITSQAIENNMMLIDEVFSVDDLNYSKEQKKQFKRMIGKRLLEILNSYEIKKYVNSYEYKDSRNRNQVGYQLKKDDLFERKIKEILDRDSIQESFFYLVKLINKDNVVADKLIEIITDMNQVHMKAICNFNRTNKIDNKYITIHFEKILKKLRGKI